MINRRASDSVEMKYMLVIDSSERMIDNAGDWLERNCLVSFANSIEKAISILKNKNPMIILADYNTLINTCEQEYDELYALIQGKKIPVYLLTETEDYHEKYYRDIEFSGHIYKYLKAGEVKQAVQKALSFR